MKVAILANPNSGRGKGATAAKYAEKILERRGFIPVIHYSNSNHRSRTLAKHISFRYKKVIAIGGDATINEVINGIARSSCILGIIPTGTANILAHELGISEDTEKAFTIAIDGEERKIDLGKVNDRYFSIACSIGFDEEVISEVKPVVKQLFHKEAYEMNDVAKIINNRPEHLNIKIDESLLSEGYFIVIANSKHYEGSFSIPRENDLGDGLLDVCIYKNDSNMDFLKNLAAVTTEKELSLDGAEYYRAKDIEIQTEKPVLIQTDGKVVGSTPAKITIQPKQLTVMVPHPHEE